MCIFCCHFFNIWVLFFFKYMWLRLSSNSWSSCISLWVLGLQVCAIISELHTFHLTWPQNCEKMEHSNDDKFLSASSSLFSIYSSVDWECPWYPGQPSRHQPPLGWITITHSSSARKEGENHLFPFSNQKLIIKKVIGFNIKMEPFCSRDVMTYMLKKECKQNSWKEWWKFAPRPPLVFWDMASL